MAIRLVNGCVNCENLTEDNICKVYKVKVGGIDCLSCSKFNTAKCVNKDHAAEGMLCNEWTPSVIEA